MTISLAETPGMIESRIPARCGINTIIQTTFIFLGRIFQNDREVSNYFNVSLLKEKN